MAETDDRKQPGATQEDLWAAINAFEQILEIMPNDRSSLETLSRAYEQIGDVTRALDMMLRLGEALIAEGDGPAAEELKDRLIKIGGDDPRCRDLAARLDRVAEVKPAVTTQARADEPVQAASEGVNKKREEALRRPFEMAEELAFAWALLEDNEIQQDEYASVVQDLTEMSAGNAAHTVSLLHVLEGRQFKNLGRIMAYAAERCRTPVLSLDSFDLKGEILELLPLSFAVQRGALVFDLIDRDAVVVVLNPFNKQLQADLQAILSRKVYVYLTLPSEFDNGVKRIREALAAQNLQDAKA